MVFDTYFLGSVGSQNHSAGVKGENESSEKRRRQKKGILIRKGKNPCKNFHHRCDEKSTRPAVQRLLGFCAAKGIAQSDRIRFTVRLDGSNGRSRVNGGRWDNYRPTITPDENLIPPVLEKEHWKGGAEGGRE